MFNSLFIIAAALVASTSSAFANDVNVFVGPGNVRKGLAMIDSQSGDAQCVKNYLDSTNHMLLVATMAATITKAESTEYTFYKEKTPRRRIEVQLTYSNGETASIDCWFNNETR